MLTWQSLLTLCTARFVRVCRGTRATCASTVMSTRQLGATSDWTRLCGAITTLADVHVTIFSRAAHLHRQRTLPAPRRLLLLLATDCLMDVVFLVTQTDSHLQQYTTRVYSAKRNVTVWRPSVRLSRRHTHRDSPAGSKRRGQRTFRPDE